MDIAKLVREQQDKDEMLRNALERIIQLYTDKAHFIYELLQNAEDAQAKVIKFHQTDDCLVVYHDGLPFTLDNLNSLCSIGASDKAENLNQIGEFGVGFKSVFGICKIVRLYSTPRNSNNTSKSLPAFAQEINNFTEPSNIPFETIPEPYTTKFIFPYGVGESFSGFKTFDALKTAIAERLCNLGVTTLLFMKHLECIEYEIDCEGLESSGCYMLDKKGITPLCNIITAIGDTNGAEEELSFLKYSKQIPDINADRTVDIAYPVIIGKDGGYSFKKATTPFISVYFPTETESKVPLIVQGPYRTTPNRSSIPYDEEENIILAELTAELLYDSVLDIKDQGQMSLQLLNILPLQEPEYSNNWLLKPLHEKTITLFEKEKIIPTADGSLINAELAKIARGQELINIFSGGLLGQLIDDEAFMYENGEKLDVRLWVPYKWLPPTLTETNKELRALYSFLTNALDIEVIRPEDLRTYLRKNIHFLGRRDDTWLEQFYKYLERMPNLINRSDNGRNMLSAPFIKTANNYFVAPFRRVGNNLLPNVFMPDKGIVEGFHFVHPFLAEQCRSFFTHSLELTAPDQYEWFKKTIEKRYNAQINVTDEEHIEDIRLALKYLSDNRYKRDLQDILDNLFFIRCQSDEGTVYVKPNYPNLYLERSWEGVSIKDYFASESNFYFVDSLFYSENSIDSNSIEKLGIKGSLITGLDNRYWYYSGEGNALWYDVDGFRSKLDFVGIDSVITFIEQHPESSLSKKKSKIIMELLFWAEKHLVGEIIKGKTVRAREKAQAIIVDVLTNGRRCYYAPRPKWLFDKNGKLVNPAEISKYDINTEVYGDLKRDSNVYDILGFVHTEKDEFEEAITNIACMLEREEQPHYAIFERLLALVEKYRPGAKAHEGRNAGDEYFHPDAETWEHEFPSRPVKNLDRLKEAVERQYLSAPKVTYEMRQRRIRSSIDEENNRSYLKSLYTFENSRSSYVCQMCKKPTYFFEAVQIENEPKLELSQMHLLLCPNCAIPYRILRNNSSIHTDFISRLCAADETQDEPVCVSVDSREINFTATHIAEIKEILKLNVMHQSNDEV